MLGSDGVFKSRMGGANIREKVFQVLGKVCEPDKAFNVSRYAALECDQSQDHQHIVQKGVVALASVAGFRKTERM